MDEDGSTQDNLLVLPGPDAGCFTNYSHARCGACCWLFLALVRPGHLLDHLVMQKRSRTQSLPSDQDASAGHAYAPLFRSTRDPLQVLDIVANVFPETGLDLRASCRSLAAQPSVAAGASTRGLLCAAAALGRLELLDSLLCNPRVDLGFLCHARATDAFILWMGRLRWSAMPAHDVLGHACRCGETDSVARLLQDPRVNPTVMDSFALHVACIHGHGRVVELLLGNIRVDPGNHALILASYHGHAAIIDMLLMHPRLHLSDRCTALGLAARGGHLDVVNRLLTDPRTNPADGEMASSALYEACCKGRLIVVERLLQPDVSARIVDTNDASAMKIAMEYGHADVVDRLLRDRQADELDMSEHLWFAALHGHVAVVHRLLQDPRVAWDDNAITRASESGHTSVVERLLQDPRADPAVDDNAPIRTASKCGRLNVVRRLLVDPRVDPSARDNEAIRRACRRGYLAVSKLLIADPRVNPAARDNSALHQALRKRRTGVVALLLTDARVRALESEPDSASDEVGDFGSSEDEGDLPEAAEAKVADIEPISQCSLQ